MYEEKESGMQFVTILGVREKLKVNQLNVYL